MSPPLNRRICYWALITGLSVSAWASDRGRGHLDNPMLPEGCGSCHVDGEGLEEAGTNEDLAQMINMCVQGPLKGQALDENSSEMESLKLFIKSLKK